jgi:epoxyqueuosine reductase
MSSTERMKQRARELGFSHAGVATAQLLDEEGVRLREWLARGFHADMQWMKSGMEKRIDPDLVLPNARSIVSVAMNYYVENQHPTDARAGKISRYAWGDDYHQVLLERLRSLAAWIEAEVPGSQAKAYVDTGPLLEKAWAQRAGIGWIGKHTNLITTDMGSWVFLGEVVTTAEFEADEPAADHCGNCRLCIDACPTGAITGPYVVDARLCLSYLTIEHRGEVPQELTGKFEGWIYGCDICQDVCPWNEKHATSSEEPGFSPREHNRSPDLEEWSIMTEEEFRRLFRGSAMKRAKHQGLLRNVRIVLDHAKVGQI